MHTDPGTQAYLIWVSVQPCPPPSHSHFEAALLCLALAYCLPSLPLSLDVARQAPQLVHFHSANCSREVILIFIGHKLSLRSIARSIAYSCSPSPQAHGCAFPRILETRLAISFYPFAFYYFVLCIHPHIETHYLALSIELLNPPHDQQTQRQPHNTEYNKPANTYCPLTGYSGRNTCRIQQKK